HPQPPPAGKDRGLPLPAGVHRDGQGAGLPAGPAQPEGGAAMNPVRRFFRRYVLSTVGLLALLLAANILLIVGLLLISEVTPPRESFSITAFCGHLSQGPDGWQADAQATAMLDPGAWAMVLDPEGNVVWEYQMPDGPARHYSDGAVGMLGVASLEDWPTRTS